MSTATPATGTDSTSPESRVRQILSDWGCSATQVDALMERHGPLGVYVFNTSTLCGHNLRTKCADALTRMQEAALAAIRSTTPERRTDLTPTRVMGMITEAVVENSRREAPEPDPV